MSIILPATQQVIRPVPNICGDESVSPEFADERRGERSPAVRLLVTQKNALNTVLSRISDSTVIILNV